jgi:membrane fusion protein (multidrug efflux system)
VLGATSKLKLLFSIPEQGRAKFQQSQIRFTVDSFPGQVFTAFIHSASVSADPHTRNFGFEAIFDNAQEKLLPGMVAKVNLPLGGKSDGVEVPVDALEMDGTEASVYVVSNGRVEHRRVLVSGRRAESALIQDGLRSGEHVVRSPKNLTDGGPVSEVTK